MAGIGALLAIGAVPATAAAQMAPASVGNSATITSAVTRTDMMPIPGTDANDTGLAYPGDNISAICIATDNHNLGWVFALDRSGHAGQFANTTGWIQAQYLIYLQTPNLPSCPFGSHIVTGLLPQYTQTDMKPIPGTDANDTGLAHNSDTLYAFCSLNDNNGLTWQLLLDSDGHGGQFQNTVGFVPYIYTDNVNPAPPC